MQPNSGGISYLDLLRGQIDIFRVPFSDRGSRLVIQQAPGRSSLQVKLGERLTALDSHPEAYLGRPPFIQSLQFIDQNGEALPFDASGSPDVLNFQTQLGKFKLIFKDEETLAIGLPTLGVAGIRLQVNNQHFKPRSDAEPIRTLLYASNGEIFRDEITATASGTSIEYILQPGRERTLLLSIGEAPRAQTDVPPFSELQQAATDRWARWFERVPPVAPEYAEKYAFAWWVMANNLISPRGCITVEGMAPSKSAYIGLWLWDSALHAIAYRHADPALARDQIRAFLALQQPDGMLPDAIFDESAVFDLDHPIAGKVTKPPILGWAALKIHEVAPNLPFLREIYPALARLNSWWFEQGKEGMAQYTHPYSSGLDNSPLWDHGMPVESPDLNTYLVLSMQSLARMARLLRMKSEAIAWKQAAEDLVERTIQKMWNQKTGTFHALHNGQVIPVLTSANLLPLWTGRLPARIVKRLLKTLTDPRKFWGDHILPSVARDDPAFDPETMWRGPVWANFNYFFVEALNLVRRKELARELRTATLKMIMAQPSIHEYYSAETGIPPATSAPAFGWTAALFIDLALQATREMEPPDTEHD